MKGREYGVIRALRAMRRHALVPVDDATRIKSLGRGGHATNLVVDLLDTLPPAADLAAILASAYASRLGAEGATPKAQQLRDASRRIEDVLNACRAFAVSTDAEAVAVGKTIMGHVMADPLGCIMSMTPGDFISTNHHGAMVEANYPNGQRWELSLRKAHPEIDADVPEGHWILEGGALLDGDRNNICVELDFGKALPSGIAEQVKLHARRLNAACLTNVRVLRTA